jgi:hypothetical protein
MQLLIRIQDAEYDMNRPCQFGQMCFNIFPKAVESKLSLVFMPVRKLAAFCRFFRLLSSFWAPQMNFSFGIHSRCMGTFAEIRARENNEKMGQRKHFSFEWEFHYYRGKDSQINGAVETSGTFPSP